MVEQWTLNPLVASSNPANRTLMFKDSSEVTRSQLVGMISYLRGFITTILIEFKAVQDGEKIETVDLIDEAKWLLKNTAFDLAHSDAASDGYFDKSWLDFNRR